LSNCEIALFRLGTFDAMVDLAEEALRPADKSNFQTPV
jgi:hypothetical protein